MIEVTINLKYLQQESMKNDYDREYPDFANVVSLTFNTYMLNDVYFAPKLKQIECGFCQEV